AGRPPAQHFAAHWIELGDPVRPAHRNEHAAFIAGGAHFNRLHRLVDVEMLRQIDGSEQPMCRRIEYADGAALLGRNPYIATVAKKEHEAGATSDGPTAEQ